MNGMNDDDDAPGHPSDYKIHARMLSLSHTMLFNGHYYTFVTNFLDPEYKAKYLKAEARHGGHSCFWLHVFVQVVVSMGLPYIYAHSLMGYPCSVTEVNLHEGQESKTVGVSEMNCEIEDFLKSPWSLLIGPISLVTYSVLFVMTRCAGHWGLMVKQKIRKILYPMIIGHLQPLTYHRGHHFMNLPDTFCFALCAGIYTLTIVQMLIVSAMRMSGVAALLGIAIGDVFLRVAGLLLAPCEEVIAQMEGELDMWQPMPYLWTRIRKNTQTIMYVRSEELLAVYDNVPRLNDEVLGYGPKSRENGWFNEVQCEDIQGGTDDYIWEQLYVQKVYVTDWNMTIPIREDEEDSEWEELSES